MSSAGGSVCTGSRRRSLAIMSTSRIACCHLPTAPGGAGNPTTLQNVGSVRNYGVEVTGTYRVVPAVSLYASYSYGKAEYRDNVISTAVGSTGQIDTATKGKTVPDNPEHMLKGEAVYDDGRFLARVGANYMSKRYFTYLNDEAVPGRVLVDGGAGI